MYKNLIEHILAAQKEAVKNTIEANTLILNNDLAISSGFAVVTGNAIAHIPPMILGLKTVYAKEKDLPSNVSFMIGDTPFGKKTDTEAVLDNFTTRIGINLEQLAALEESQEIYFRTKNGDIKVAVVDSIDIINRIVTAHEPSKSNHRVRKYDCHTFTFREYGTIFSVNKEELECLLSEF